MTPQFPDLSVIICVSVYLTVYLRGVFPIIFYLPGVKCAKEEGRHTGGWGVDKMLIAQHTGT